MGILISGKLPTPNSGFRPVFTAVPFVQKQENISAAPQRQYWITDQGCHVCPSAPKTMRSLTGNWKDLCSLTQEKGEGGKKGEPDDSLWMFKACQTDWEQFHCFQLRKKKVSVLCMRSVRGFRSSLTSARSHTTTWLLTRFIYSPAAECPESLSWNSIWRTKVLKGLRTRHSPTDCSSCFIFLSSGSDEWWQTVVLTSFSLGWGLFGFSMEE